MEKVSKVQFILMVFLVLMGLLVAQSTAASKICYDQCSSICKLHHSKVLKACINDCLKMCNPRHDAQFFCKLGCTSSLCSTKENHLGPEKVPSCAEFCSETCTMI